MKLFNRLKSKNNKNEDSQEIIKSSSNSLSNDFEPATESNINIKFSKESVVKSDLELKNELQEQFAWCTWTVRNRDNMPTDIAKVQARWLNERADMVEEAARVIAFLDQKGIVLVNK